MLNKLKLQLRALFRKTEMEQELDEELQFHLDKEVEENLKRGLSPDEARREAFLSFGGVERVKEESRDARGVRPFEEAWYDLRYSTRLLLNKPSFMAAALLTLAIGIGASTAIFSIVDAVLIRPLPYPEAANIVTLREVDAKGQPMTFAERNFLDVRARNHTLASAAQYNTQLEAVLGGSEPVRTRIAFVSGEFFKTLGVQPAIGRPIAPEDNKFGDSAIAVVSHAFWRRLLGSSVDLTATPLRVGDKTFTIVGVMPQGFNFPRDAEVWLPIELFPPSESRTSHGRRVVARLHNGITLDEARAELSAIGKQLNQENTGEIDLVGIATISLKEAMIGEASQSLLVILAAVGFLLLVACTNVANLLLAQASTRLREFAVRSALGATHGRLARQLIVESLLLALLSGGFGALLAFWGVKALIGLDQGFLPRADEVGVDGRAMAFTLGLSTLVAVVLGFVPLLRIGRSDLQQNLKESSRGHSTASHRLRSLLVVTQVASTLVLVVGAGLLIKSFVKVLEVDPGFRPDSAAVMEISLSGETAERRANFYRQALERLTALPGIRSVGGVNGLPMVGGAADGQFLIDNNPELKGYGQFRVASPGYFDAMGMRLVSGRLFDQTDGPQTEQVALISESLARKYLSDGNPLGRGIQYGNMDGDKHLLTVVGVVSDVREFGLEADAEPTVYVHYLQRPRQAWGFAMVARTQGDVQTLIPAMRNAVQQLNSDVPMKLRTLGQIFSSSLDNRRFSLVIFGSFAVVALLVAALGIYGVTSYAVTQRTQEIGIRIALGARVPDVLRMVIGQGMRSVLLGIAIGLSGGLALTRVIAHLLFKVSPTDALTFTVVITLIVFVALIACYLPARRATKVDPMITLRYE